MPSTPRATRRVFLGTSALAAAGRAPSVLPAEMAKSARPRPERVIDCHAHLAHHSRRDYLERDRRLIDAADRLGIDQLCASILTPTKPASLEGFRQCNAWLGEAIDRFPGRVLGYCYVNPGYGREAVEEIRRAVLDRGFIGVKLYNEYTATEPVLYPIVETAIELRVPILFHAGHSHYFNTAQPRISDGGHIAQLAQRYPEAMLICGHVGGGGDWEWTIKSLRHAKSVYLDTSGSVIDEGMVDMAARVLGAGRLLFGCDMSMTAGVGKLRAANLSGDDYRRVMGGNMQAILARRNS